MKISPHSSIEPLEARIAPAATIINGGLGATYTDADGDHVTVKVTSGALTAGNFTLVATPLGEQLQKLDLSGGGVDGADLTISVKKSATGDGRVSVGNIDSTDHDLGKVRINGNLDQLTVGDATTNDGAMTSLKTASLGTYAVSGSALIFNGRLGSLTVAGDVRDVEVFVQGGATDGTLGPVKIGGSLLGGGGDFSGSILAQGSIGAVKIGKHAIAGAGGQSAFIRSIGGGIQSVSVGGSLIGGNGNGSGTIEASGAIGSVVIKGDLIGHDGLGSGIITSDTSSITSVTIGGSLMGGNSTSATGDISAATVLGTVKIGGDVRGGSGGGGGFFSGSVSANEITSLTVGGSILGGSGPGSGVVFASKIGKATIGKDLFGGTGANSGRLASTGDMTNASVGGSVIGGSKNGTGEIIAGGDLTTLTIKGSLIGGSLLADDLANTALDEVGYIEAKHFGNVTIGGSIVSGVDRALLGTLTKSGSIRAIDDIASITVKGSLIGNSGPKGDSPVVISAKGDATTHLAIGKLTVGGMVTRANILGGFGVALDPLDGDAQIGTVSAGGDWIASTITAGVQNLGTNDMAGGTGTDQDNVNFGDAHDVSIAGATGLASITSINIKGLVAGSAAASDHFGFMSHAIGSFKALGFKSPAPAVNANLSPVTGDVSIHIV